MPSGATIRLLLKYGQRCVACYSLATSRKIRPQEGYKTTTLRFGSLETECVVGEDGASTRTVRHEIQDKCREWLAELSQSEELTNLIQEINLEAIAGVRDLTESLIESRKEPYSSWKDPLPCYCDYCGDPNWRYQDLEVAPLVRKFRGRLPEPLVKTRFERILDED